MARRSLVVVACRSHTFMHLTHTPVSQDPVPVEHVELVSVGARAPGTPAARHVDADGLVDGLVVVDGSQTPPVLRRLDEEDEDDFVARRPSKVLPFCTYG